MLILKETPLGEEPGLPGQCPTGNRACSVHVELDRLREECERLRNLSLIDTLTGLYNFRYLRTALDVEMERTRRTSVPTSLLMVDLDYFKHVNDTYGHECGNKALQWVSDFFSKNLRDLDIPCRYGGEEFTIILPSTRLPEAGRIAERLRVGLKDSRVELDGGHIQLTASFGVSAYKGRRRLSAEELIKRADRYLLEAKIKGRNRVCSEPFEEIDARTEVTEEERRTLYMTTGF
jgi:diguanylate cyclase (GGDEF)-like protein